MSAFLDAAQRILQDFRALGVMPYFWPLTMAVSVVFGVRRVMHHMRTTRVLLGDGQLLGTQTNTDISGATLFRSAERVARRPSLSPFFGRPVWMRGLPAPTVVAYLWALSTAPLPTEVGTAGAAAYATYRTTRRVRNWRHQRHIVRPMTRALSPQLGVPADRILDGIVVPRHYQAQDAEIVIPMPDDWRPGVLSEAGRITAERLGGEWKHSLSSSAPYLLTLRHKPVPPGLVTFDDVAERMANSKIYHPFLGLGTEHEERYLDFAGQVVHLGISGRTGAGKSTINLSLLTQNAIAGVVRQAGIDVKGDSFEGAEHVPGFELYNDIGDLDTYSGMPLMWKVIRSFALEMDARRKGLRGPKEAWDVWFLFLEEQNMFAEFTSCAWNLMREKDDPKICPVYTDIRNIGFMGRSFKIRIVWAGQNMSADALGGGNMSKGGELRGCFGNKLLGRFEPRMWDNLVGSRPRAESSDIPGRWTLVNNANLSQAVQTPLFKPEHSMELLAHAGHRLSPAPSPHTLSRPNDDLTGAAGDTGTGDKAGTVLYLRGQDVPELAAPTQDYTEREMRDPEPTEDRYTLEEACNAGILRRDYEAAKRARTRARKNGEFPEGRKEGSKATTYTADELLEWERIYDHKQAQ